MRKGYNPVDRNECDSEEEDALPDDDAQECLDPTADPPDPADDEGIKAAETGPSNESPLARSDDPTSPRTPPRQDSDKEDEDWLPDIPDAGFPMSLSMEDTILDMDDLRQYAAIKFLQQADQPRGDENTDNEAGVASSDVSSDGSDDKPQPPAWTQNPETQAEQIAIERGQKLVMMFENTPLCDIDPAWFILSFPDYFPNGRGLPPKGVSLIAWLKYLIRIDGSPFQRDDFICAAGDWVLRHSVNLSAWLQFKVASSEFNEAKLAEEEDMVRLATILARRGRPKNTDNRVVHALYSQVVAVASRTESMLYATPLFRRKVFAGWQHWGIFGVYFTINKAETRSPFCWRMAGADNELWHFPQRTQRVRRTRIAR